MSEGVSVQPTETVSNVCDLPKPSAFMGAVQSIPVAGCFFGGCKNTKRIRVNEITQIMGEIMVKSSTKCQVKTGASQTLSVVESQSSPPIRTETSAPGCGTAKALFPLINRRRLDLVATAIGLGYKDATGELRQKQQFSQAVLDSKRPTGDSAPWVETACRSIIVRDIVQTSRFRIDASCELSEEIVNSSVAQAVSDYEQKLNASSDVSGKVAQLLSGGSSDCISKDLRATLNQAVKQDLFKELLAESIVAQNITVRGDSVMVSGATQSLDADIVIQLASSMKLSNRLYGEVESKGSSDLLSSEGMIDKLTNLLTGLVGVGGDEGQSRVAVIISSIFGMVALMAMIYGVVILYRNYRKNQETKRLRDVNTGQDFRNGTVVGTLENSAI